MTLGYSWSLLANPMNVINYILGMTGGCSSIWKNENEARMNELSRLCVYKEGSIVEVPYFEPLFWKVLISSPWFQGLMAYERMIWTMWYDMYNMLCEEWYEQLICAICYVLFAKW